MHFRLASSLVFPSVFLLSNGQFDRDFSDSSLVEADVESDTFNVVFENDYENSGLDHSGDDDLPSVGRSAGIDSLARRRRKKKKKKKKNKKRKKKPVKQVTTPPSSLFKGIDDLMSSIQGDYNYSKVEMS